MNSVSRTLYRNNLKLVKNINKEVFNIGNNIGSIYILSQLNDLKQNYERDLGFSKNSTKELIKKGYRNFHREDLEFNVYKDLNYINNMIYDLKNSQRKYSYLSKRQNDNENLINYISSKKKL